MKATVNFNDFCDSFTGGYKESFSYEGKRALFDYLEDNTTVIECSNGHLIIAPY